jgi:ATP-binding protein involved in chromosome partitioning
LGEIPIDPRVTECGDGGDPIVHKYPDSPVAKAYLALSETVRNELSKGQEKDLPEMQF